MPQKAGSATLKMTMIWKNEISQIAINHKTSGASSIIEGAPFGMLGMRIFLPQILGITQMQITSVSEIICLICAICGCFTLKKRIFTLLVNSSPSTLQVIVTLTITEVIHFKALVTHLSPKTLYLVEYVENIRANHSSPLISIFRVTSEFAM